jgi:hypothetical protein
LTDDHPSLLGVPWQGCLQKPLLLPLLLLLLHTCAHRFEAIMVSNLLIKLAALPLTIFSQKNAPLMAVRQCVTPG